jgi:hypothetical protein
VRAVRRWSPDRRALLRAFLFFSACFAGLFVLFGLFLGPTGIGGLGVMAAVSAVVAVVFGTGGRRREAFDVAQNPEVLVRRAVFQGLIRTAFSAVLVLFVGYGVLFIASSLWQTRGDREDRFGLVLGTGFEVAHPDYEMAGVPYCCNVNLTSLELVLSLTPRTASFTAPIVNDRLRISLRGRVERDSVPILDQTPISAALQQPAPTPGQTRAVLKGLPRSITTFAIVQLRKPLGMRAFRRLLGRHGYMTLLDVPPIFLESPYLRRSSDYGPGSPLTWPGPVDTPHELGDSDVSTAGSGLIGPEDVNSLAQFRAWARELRPSDDRNLGVVGLPSAEEIKAVAANARVHGFIAERASVTRLRRLLADREVASVNVADAAFDLNPTIP